MSSKNTKVTLVTGIWDIKRSNLSEGWSRSFEHYLNNLEKLLKTPDNLIIFIEEKYEAFVWERRTPINTQVVVRELNWFKSNIDVFEKIQKIRTNPDWYNQAAWLSSSTQAQLEWYNPLVMSKIFLLNDARILDKFDSTHLVWIDGGITNTVHEGYFWHDRVISKLGTYFSKFSFVAFPYDGKVEIHGFEYSKLCEYAGAEVDKVCRGGIFGGPKHTISEVNQLYYSLLIETLSEGYMGTEESLLTVLSYQYPDLFQCYNINADGLLGTFFEFIKTDVSEVEQEEVYMPPNVALYVLTYNSPKQFETLCESFQKYDEDFLTDTTKYLINNSTNPEVRSEYDILCEKYKFIQISKDNIGICGGRQFIAEHFAETEHTHYIFYEDDMFFYEGPEDTCRNGFPRKVKKLFQKALSIIEREKFDFLKFNFTEFFGDNSTQWAWYNVPQDLRDRIWPDNNRLPEIGQARYAPKTSYRNIKSYMGLAYADGEVYYCNWPQIVSKRGNKKMFLDTKWQHPYEQTWMSYLFQQSLENKLSSAVLLATPTEHNRFDHYPAEERREH